jgi:hypothetical protein
MSARCPACCFATALLQSSSSVLRDIHINASHCAMQAVAEEKAESGEDAAAALEAAAEEAYEVQPITCLAYETGQHEHKRWLSSLRLAESCPPRFVRLQVGESCVFCSQTAVRA